ncbi:uncharacterized protein LOC135467857 [Liolophura sinensis]|uniref:uncharacterized protein LOC135467857 n=1 Tax=Liolophura sinensis TaxID=3198878 RepID=UPI003159748E
MEPIDETENHVFRLKPKKRKSNRRSSILKSPSRNNALGDLDPNAQVDDNRMSRQSRSRRVSFADTYQILEFAKDIHNTPDLGILENTYVEKEENGVSVNDAGSHISGLDKLLTGSLCNQLLDDTHEVKELPFPKDPDGSSLLSQSSSPHASSEPDQPGATVDMTTFIQSLRSAADNLEQVSDSPPKKVDMVAFLKTLRKVSPVKQPPESVSEQGFLQSLSRGIYNTSDQGDVSTIINTSLNKYLSSPVSADKAGLGVEELVPRHKSAGAPARDLMCHETFAAKNLKCYPHTSEQFAEITAHRSQQLICNTQTSTDEMVKKYDIKRFLQKLGGKTSTNPMISDSTTTRPRGFMTHLGTLQESSENSSPEDHNPGHKMTSAEFATLRCRKFAGKHKPVEDKENMFVGCLQFSVPRETKDGYDHREPNFLAEEKTNNVLKTLDITQRFSGTESEAGMEMTVCHGNIVVDNHIFGENSKHEMKFTDMTQRFSGLENEAAMEMTMCHGNFAVDRDVEQMRNPTDFTQRFSGLESDGGMEMTACHGSIFVHKPLFGDNSRHGMQCTDVTQRFSGLESNAGMEMTTCHGNIIVDKSIQGQNINHLVKVQSAGQEANAVIATESLSGEINISNVIKYQIKIPKHGMKHTDVTQRFSGQESDAEMEMTTCHGNIVDKFLSEQNTKHTMKDMDVTHRCSGQDSDAGMEMTICHGNIAFDRPFVKDSSKDGMQPTDVTQRYSGQDSDAGMEMTTCQGNIVVDRPFVMDNAKDGMQPSDVTQRYSGRESDAGMEMTTCQGNIVVDRPFVMDNAKDGMQLSDVTQRYSGQENDAGMEMTTCQGNIVVDRPFVKDNAKDGMQPSDVTQRYSGQENDAGMEMTTCQGNIVVDRPFVKDNAKDGMQPSDVTQRYSGQESDAGMEMTTCQGNIVVDRPFVKDNSKDGMQPSDVTQRYSGQDSDAGMEMTTCQGNIVVDRPFVKDNAKDGMQPSDVTQRYSGQDSDAGMEMTTCQGNIVVDRPFVKDNSKDGMQPSDVTQRYSGQESDARMEMTTCQGNIVVDRPFVKDNSKDGMQPSDVTQRYSGQDSDARMEMTTCQGNIVVDRPFIKDNAKDGMQPSDVTQRYSGQESDAGMEMTTCQGNIVVDMPFVEDSTKDGMQPSDVTQRYSGQENDARMEMTTCQGNIVVDRPFVKDNAKDGMQPSDVTQRYSGQESDAGMEMTTCQGNIVVDMPFVEDSTKDGMQPSDVTQRYSGQENDARMEMTTCQGNIVVDRPFVKDNAKDGMQPSDVTQRYSGQESDAGMEMTTSQGNIVVDMPFVEDSTKDGMQPSDVTQRYSGQENDARMEMTTCHGNIVVDKPILEDNQEQIHGSIIVDRCLGEQSTGVESHSEMKMTNYNGEINLGKSSESSLKVEKSCKSSSEPKLQGYRCVYSSTLDNKFNTVSCVLGKRTFPLGRQSCEPSLYPPEKVQRLLGQTKIPSNLSYLNKKLNSLKQDPKNCSLVFGNLRKAEEQISHVPDGPGPVAGTSETRMDNIIKPIPATERDCTVSSGNEDVQTTPISELKCHTEDAGKKSSNTNLGETSDCIDKHDEDVAKSANAISQALLHEAIAAESEAVNQHRTRKQSSTDSEEDMPDIMNELEPELCALSDSPETTPQKKMPDMEPMLPPFNVQSDHVTDGQNPGPEDVDGVVSDGNTAPERTIKLSYATFTQKTDGDCLLTENSCDMLKQFSLRRGGKQESVQLSGMCDLLEQTNSVLVTEATTDTAPVETAGLSKPRGDKSIMDVSILQCSQGGRANVSMRRENTSCQNLSSFSFLQTEPYLSKAPCTAEQFMQMVCITTCMDWSATGRRSSFAPPQCHVEDLSLSEILDKVLIDRAEVLMVETAVEEMESQRTRLLSIMRELEQDIEDNSPDVFQYIVQSKEEFEEIKRQSLSCWSACRKKAKLMGKESKLRWLVGENAALQANKVRMSEALQEVEDKCQSADMLLQTIDEAMATEFSELGNSCEPSEEVDETDGSCAASEAGLCEENQLQAQLELATKGKDECEAKVATLNRDLTQLTENNEILNVEMIKLNKELNELTIEEEEIDKEIDKLRNQFIAHKRLVEWTVVEFCEQSASFLFLNGYIRVVVEFGQDQSTDLATPLIDLIKVQLALTDDDRPEFVLAHNMVASALSADILECYETKKDLPKLLMDISKTVWIGKSLQRDLRHVQCTHQVQVCGTSISVYFISISKVQKCCVRFDFTPSLGDLPPAAITVQTIIGDVEEKKIAKAVEGLSTEKNYLKSMVEAVEKVVLDKDVDNLWPSHTTIYS